MDSVSLLYMTTKIEIIFFKFYWHHGMHHIHLLWIMPKYNMAENLA